MLISVKKAINGEFDSTISNQTGEMVISSKWIFKKKLRPDHSMDKYEVKLVIKGSDQKKRVDYFDTYSLVTKIATITILVALVIISCLVVRQMYVKTTS